MLSSKPKPLSYRAKDETSCPICNHKYHKEILHSGGGRLIAGKLTSDLRRTYELNKKFGKVYPMAYQILTCPQCLYSSYPNDFTNLKPEEIQEIKMSTVSRRTGIEKIAGPLDFNEDRNLVLGAASYILAIDCYQLRGIQIAPTPKKAISSIRAAWLFSDMNEEFPDMGFNKVSDFLYTKAVKYYYSTLEIMSTGNEPHDQFINLLGPDTDNNWGFDGVVYLNGFLTQKYLHLLAKTDEEKIEYLDRSKRYLGKLYGMGKASKSKPSVIIDMSKDLYDLISDDLAKLQGTEAAPSE
ncbi:MAG: DUF2225 domain-containing protein [Spirochaetia bacterium]|nr:DUF2225 domain-containing protein [Spirochaetia bacterium]